MTQEDKLFQELEQGSDTALEELTQMYYADIFQYCLWHMPNRSSAEDAAQETFLKALRYFDRYTHKGHFRAFLYRIAANTCIDMKRKKWPDEPVTENLPAVEDLYVQVEAQEDFMLLLSGFPEEIREMLILRYQQDLTVKEVAKIMNLPMRTVQSKLRRTLKQLKEKLSKGGETCLEKKN